jgi:Anthranilate/para-aminobenzoate synthases component I
MNKHNFTTQIREILADTVTPVSIYLKMRDLYPNALLLESSDYRSHENSWSFICLDEAASVEVEQGRVQQLFPDGTSESVQLSHNGQLAQLLDSFLTRFVCNNPNPRNPVNGLFGYTAYDAVQHYETLKFRHQANGSYTVPEVHYGFYRFIVAINHYQNRIELIENCFEGESSSLDQMVELLKNRNIATFPFDTDGEEQSNITDEEYKHMVTKGKSTASAATFSRLSFRGSTANASPATSSMSIGRFALSTLRLISSFSTMAITKSLGRRPRHSCRLPKGRYPSTRLPAPSVAPATTNRIFSWPKSCRKTPKENAEHVMLVDLARNDLSRNADGVKVELFREVQFYSHVIHLVSKVSGQLAETGHTFRVMGDSFPAGTLSGAPKFRAMELIDQYENQNRGFYGGCIGFAGFDGSFNHAIMIRSFLSKNNTLFSQAGAGIVAVSDEESELQEVGNKLAALKKAVEMAKGIR